MNDDYQLLENIASFLGQGYLINEVLQLCNIIHQSSKVEMIKVKLEEGLALDEAIIDVGFDATFVEYFKFFRFKNNISNAIDQSLGICKNKDATFKKLKKELTYPIILIIFLMFFSLFVVYGLLPSIQQLFIEFDIEPNIITKIMFMLFKILPIGVVVIIILLLSLITVSIYAIKKQYFKLIDFLISKIPIIKQLIPKYYSIKFALYYNELLINGYDSTDIIIMLYQQIDDSDIKMLVYEIYRQILNGEAIETIINDFGYFEPLFVACFKLLIHDNLQEKSLNNYLKISVETLHFKISRIIKFIVPLVYGFTAGFVILVYVSIIIPMMNVISNL